MRFLKIFIIIAFISGCGKVPPIVKKARPLMNTWVSIKIHDSSRTTDELKELIDKAFSGIERVDELMSRFKDTSELSRINKSIPDEPIKVSTLMLAAINKASKIHELTGGAFDITIAPLIELWRFHASVDHSIPPESELRESMELVGQDKLVIDTEYGYVGLAKEGMAIDLGGIAKGFAVDEAANILKRAGVRNALIDAGGDIYCLGTGPAGQPWKVGIKHPRKNKTITTLTLKNIAVATSGDYEQSSHIIDPKTGCPVRKIPASVTVLARDCATADGLATALAVLGPERGLSLVNRLEWVEAIIISDNEDSLSIDVSVGLKGLYEFDE